MTATEEKVPLEQLAINTMGELSTKLGEKKWKSLDEEELSVEALKAATRVWDWQEEHTTSKIRIALAVGGRLDVEAELRYYHDQKEIKSAIYRHLKESGVKVEDMHTDEELDHYMPGSGREPKEGAIADPDEPGWYFGPSHGRRYTQIVVRAEAQVEGLKGKDVRDMVKQVEKAVDPFWSTHGVGVI